MKILNFIAAGGVLATVALAQTPCYTITDLGAASSPFSAANFVNRNGFVAIGAVGADGNQHSILWYQGVSGDIGGLGGPNSGAGGVNNSGLAMGGANANWGGINNAGEIAGVAETNVRDPLCPAGVAANGLEPQVLDYEPVIWGPGPGQIRQLPLPAGDTVGYAFGINDLGQTVGMTGTCATTTLPGPAASLHAVLWENGAVTDLGNLGGTFNTAVFGRPECRISARCRGTWQAQVWQSTIGEKSLGLPLPRHGETAGIGVTSDGNIHAFLGNQNASSGTTPTGTTAIVTPLNLTTSDSSVVLDASGNRAQSPIVMLNYQSS
jgi:probable HAF family extracellular repeat protein